MKEKTFKGFTKGQIESVFDQLNMYGMDLLSETVLAWEFDHEEDASILREAYDDMLETKESDPNEESRNRYTDKRGLKKALVNMEDDEIEFLDKLIELDPNDVFVNNPYYDETDYEDVPVKSTQDIFRKFLEEAKLNIAKRKLLKIKSLSDEAKKFDLRFKRSMNNKKTPGGYNPYSF